MTDLLLTNATLLDLETGALHERSSVRVEGDRIVEVALGRTLAGGANVEHVDAAGLTLMPGLIDAHVHAGLTTLDLGALAHRPPTRLGIEAKNVLEGMLRRGFTTVRDAGGLDLGVQQALDAGLVQGPRVFRSGRVLSQTGGHGDTHPPSNEPHLCACHIESTQFAHIADGPDAVRRAVREELKGGAHQIKVMAGGGVATPSDPIDMVQYTAEEIRAAVQEAASRRTYAFAHAYVPDAIIQAVEEGVRSIEHGNLLDEHAAAVMAEHGTFLVPTLVVYEQITELGRQWGFPVESLTKLEQVQAAGKRAIRVALDAGVRVGFGTDLLGETHPAQSRELLLRADVQSNLDVLRSATLVNADLLGRSGALGVIAPGAHADLLLVDGNPVEDLEVLTRHDESLRMVVRNGDVVVDRTRRAAAGLSDAAHRLDRRRTARLNSLVVITPSDHQEPA
jgi:imidazolonepropionase-like amidohydrolase